jgi:hypothetical protein
VAPYDRGFFQASASSRLILAAPTGPDRDRLGEIDALNLAVPQGQLIVDITDAE